MRRIMTWLTATTLAAGVVLEAAPAEACGGFFCDNALPVNQAAERIIFSHNGDGTVTSVVQILYTGPAEQFAWVLPVPGRPEVGISSNTAFTRLQNATNPSYQMTTRIEGECRTDSRSGFDDSAGPGAPMAADAGAADGGGSVTVVDQGTVGPYDYVTISLDPALPSPGDVAVEWLRDNGYDVTDFGRDRLGPYLAAGMNLIAFRLSKGNATGSIRPIIISYTGTRPMIPIRPTAVAAEDDMGVLVWVLGAHRAVPINFRHLVLNDALINWFSPMATYDAVVSAAADEAGGQGFVTEDARPTSALPDVFGAGEEIDTDSLAGASDQQLVQQLIARYGPWDGLADALRGMIVFPEGVPEESFLGCPFCFGEIELTEAFDREGLLAAMETLVIAPMRQTQAILGSRPYITRLYTTMSADEMTMDPEFDLNPDLGDHSNVHRAERVIECRSDVWSWEAPWRTTLPDGRVVRGRASTWPFALGGEMPAAERIEQADVSGEPEVVSSRSDAIMAQIDANNRANPPGDVTGDGVPDLEPGLFGGGGCSVGGAGAGGLVLGLFALFVTRRRFRL